MKLRMEMETLESFEKLETSVGLVCFHVGKYIVCDPGGVFRIPEELQEKLADLSKNEPIIIEFDKTKTIKKVSLPPKRFCICRIKQIIPYSSEYDEIILQSKLKNIGSLEYLQVFPIGRILIKKNTTKPNKIVMLDYKKGFGEFWIGVVSKV